MPVSKSVALTCSTVVPEARKREREKERWCHWLKLESFSTNFHSHLLFLKHVRWPVYSSVFIIRTTNENKKLQHVFISEIGTRTRCSALCIRMNSEKVQHFFSILFLLVGCVSRAYNRLRNCTFPLFGKSESIECVRVCVCVCCTHRLAYFLLSMPCNYHVEIVVHDCLHRVWWHLHCKQSCTVRRPPAGHCYVGWKWGKKVKNAIHTYFRTIFVFHFHSENGFVCFWVNFIRSIAQ